MEWYMEDGVEGHKVALRALPQSLTEHPSLSTAKTEKQQVVKEE